MTRCTGRRLYHSSVASAIAIIAIVVLRLLLLVNVFRFFGRFVTHNSENKPFVLKNCTRKMETNCNLGPSLSPNVLRR